MSGKNGSSILQPGKMNVNLQQVPGNVGGSVAAFPGPNGVEVVTIGGMHPFIFMCACVAAGGRFGAYPDDIVIAADKIITEATRYLQKKNQPAPAAESEPQPLSLVTE